MGPQTDAASGTHKTQTNKRVESLVAFCFWFFPILFYFWDAFRVFAASISILLTSSTANQLRRLLKYPVSETFQLSETFYPTEMRYKISHPVTKKYAKYTSPFHLGIILSCRPHRLRSFHILQVALLFALVPFTRTATQPTALCPVPILIVLFAYRNVLTMRSCLNWNRLARCAARFSAAS